MKDQFFYMSKDEVLPGDIVRINNDRFGRVVNIIKDDTSAEGSYYFNEFGPGVLFNFDDWGNIYYPAEDISDDEDLFLVRRQPWENETGT